MESEVLKNPWLVDSVKDFTFICCPECVYKSKEERPFQIHALRNHPKAKVLFEIPDDLDTVDEIPESKDTDINGHNTSKNPDGTFDEGLLYPKSDMDIRDDSNFYTNDLNYYSNDTNFYSNESIRCDHCDETFETFQGLIDHSRNYHEVKKEQFFECSECEETFTNKSAKRRHMKEVHPKPKSEIESKYGAQMSQKWKCDHCDDVKFHLKKDLFNHYDEMHPKFCLHCNLKFETMDEKSKHMNEKHAMHKCENCDLFFKSKMELIGHLVKVHDEVVKKVKCFLCPEEFNRSSLPLIFFKMTNRWRC